MTARESGGTGRRARLRGVWLHRTGSSPVSRTKKHTSVCFFFCVNNAVPDAYIGIRDSRFLIIVFFRLKSEHLGVLAVFHHKLVV